MPMDDALDDGQPHAGAFVLLGAVQALKDAKEFIGVSHVESDAVVTDKIDCRHLSPKRSGVGLQI